MAFYDSFDEFCNEIEKLKGKDCYKITNFENATPIDKLSHFAYCKREGLDCDFDLSFLNNEKLQTKLEDTILESKVGGYAFFNYIYNNLFEFEVCFESKPRKNRWNLFPEQSEIVTELKNQLKEKDAIIADLKRQLSELKG